MTLNKQPENLFCSKHVWSVIGVLYITTISPAIDKALSEGLTRKEIGHLINSTLVGIIAGSLKILDKDVYTPKFIPGRNKDKALNNINQELLQPIDTNVIEQVVKHAVEDAVVNNVNTQIDNVIKQSSIVPLTTNDNISDLFKTSDVLKKKSEVEEQIIQEPIIINIEVETESIPEYDGKYGSKYHPDLLINKQLTNIVIKAKRDTFYKFEPIESSMLDDKKIIKVESGITIYIDSYTTNNAFNNHVQFTINNTTLYAFIPHVIIIDNNIEVDKEVDLSPIKEQVKQANNTSYLRPTIDQCEKVFDTIMKYSLYNDFINCLNTFDINTPLDVSHFMAQVSHESAGLRYTKEIASGVDYNDWPELGNTEPGDGPKYKGAGFLQMTGRYNYQAFANAIDDQRVMEGVDYVAATYPFTSAGFWWKNNNMSNFINNQAATIEEVSTRINGANPANGLQDRIFYFNKAKKVFNIT